MAGAYLPMNTDLVALPSSRLSVGFSQKTNASPSVPVRSMYSSH